MPCPSLLPARPIHDVNVELWLATLDGRDLDATVALAREIVRAGAWRPGLIRRFIHLHRHEVAQLMRRLGPLIPRADGR